MLNYRTAKIFFDERRIASLWKFPVLHAISTRADENMADTYEALPRQAALLRNRFFQKTEFSARKTVRMITKHGTEIFHVLEAQGGETYCCDCLITNNPEIALCVAVADCLPLIITIKNRKFMALVHVGAKSAAEGIIPHILEQLTETYRIPTSAFLVGIGPGICKHCYEATHTVEKLGLADQDAWKPFLIPDRDEKVWCDLKGFVIRQLLTGGIQEKNLSVAGACTYCSRWETNGNYVFFSHVRSRTEKEPEGRFLVVVALARQPFSWKKFFGYTESIMTKQT